MWKVYLGLFGALCLFSHISSQSIEDEFSNPCTSAESCGECIGISPMCTWCGQEDFPRREKRCNVLENLKKHCDPKYISDPKSTMKVGDDKAWTSGGQGSPPVQVKPQSMEFTLRPSEPVDIKLKFRQQANYPVDLYFLLDLSYGMVREEAAQQRLIALGQDIPVSIRDITNNFRLGFGTFVDKRLMPYTAWTEQMFKDRCPFEHECRPSHDFKNQMNIGDNENSFADTMRTALETASQSLDDVEGGFDGIIQALDCNSLGWREVSRRIIVYSSNSRFHLAGAGKLGGATKQNNLKCALDSAGEYEHDTIYDYPSVSQVASKLKEKNANVIFAVMKNVSSHYEDLLQFLDGAVVGQLEENSTNIVELISKKYYELRSRIKFQANNADHVDVKFKSKCMGDVVRETAECDNLEIMDAVEFDVRLTVNKDICEGKSGIVEKDLELKAVGLNEQLVVKLKVRCECECEMPGKEKKNSTKCSDGNGTFECGICSCDPGRYGRHCECDESELSSEESLEKCRHDVNDTITCYGRGECVCGVCDCNALNPNSIRKYSGVFCECNDYSCPSGPNGLCGGSTRGICSCGQCSCFEGWSGDNCECSTDTSTCEATGYFEGAICNNTGTCVCGKCLCDENRQWVGPTCEDCPDCPSQCNEYAACAKCTIHKPEGYTEDCSKCPDIEDVDTLDRNEGVRYCTTSGNEGCTIFFSYFYTPENEVKLQVQKTEQCPDEAPVAAIVGGTVAAVVLIPLLIICLIIFIRNRRDAKEYAEFLNEKDRARWESGANPIYKDPKSTFQNPTYKGGK